MPYTDSGLWIPRELPKKKTADRPHKWTIALAIVGPVITMGTLLTAIHSLNQQNDAFELANKSYITIANASVGGDSKSLSFIVRNLGKTPSRNTELFLAELSEDGKVYNDVIRQVSYWGSIMPGEEVKYAGAVVSFIEASDKSDPDSRKLFDTAVFLLATTDVFGKKEYMSYCRDVSATTATFKNTCRFNNALDLVLPYLRY